VRDGDLAEPDDGADGSVIFRYHGHAVTADSTGRIEAAPRE